MLGKSRKSLAAATTALKYWLQQYKDAKSKAQPYAWMTPEPVKVVKVELSDASDPPPDKSGAASAGVCFSVRACMRIRALGRLCFGVYMIICAWVCAYVCASICVVVCACKYMCIYVGQSE